MSNTEHRPLLIVIAGPNGSGKTSVTSQLLKHEWVEDSIYINPDNVAQDMFGDWNAKEIVSKICRKNTSHFFVCLSHAMRNINVIFTMQYRLAELLA